MRAYKLKEAKSFSAELMSNPDMMNNPLVKCWRGRILIYSGVEGAGKQLLQEAIRDDPDLKDAMTTIKMLKKSAAKKEEASEIFKAQTFD